MLKNSKIIFLILFSGLLALFLISSRRRPPNPPIQQTGPELTQSESVGAVAVDVTPVALNAGESPKFKVVFTTHSVELDFNIEAVANLTDDRGNIINSPKWAGSPPGGHHRSGELSFGDSLGPDARSVTLAFKNIAGVPTRTFTYELLRKP